MIPTPSLERTCPRCHAPVPVYDYFRSWCDRCEWNLEEDTAEDQMRGLFNRVWLWANHRFGEREFQAALREPSPRPRFSFLALLAILISIIVHLITLALVVAFFGLVVQGVIDLLNGQMLLIWLYKFFLALLLFFLVQRIRPRLGKLPKETLRRGNAPVLFAILDRMSAAVGARKVQAVVVNPNFNAERRSVGLRQELTLWLGLPLVFSLNRDELAALLSHELAHDVNGDPVQFWVIGNAVGALSEWFDLFTFRRWVLLPEPSIFNVLLLVLQVIVWILSSVFWLLTTLLALMLYPLRQRAEYRADAIAAVVAGRKAVEQLLYKSHLREAYQILLNRAADFPKETAIFETIRLHFPDPPEREFERIRRVIAKGRRAQEPSHPSPKQRLAYLFSRPPAVGQVVISEAEFQKIIEEFSPYAAQVEAWLKEAMRAEGRVSGG